jgi:hypothetical protein
MYEYINVVFSNCRLFLFIFNAAFESLIIFLRLCLVYLYVAPLPDSLGATLRPVVAQCGNFFDYRRLKSCLLYSI